MTNITDVTRLPIGKDRKEKHMMRLKNENIVLTEALRDTINEVCRLCMDVYIKCDVCKSCRMTKYRKIIDNR